MSKSTKPKSKPAQKTTAQKTTATKSEASGSFVARRVGGTIYMAKKEGIFGSEVSPSRALIDPTTEAAYKAKLQASMAEIQHTVERMQRTQVEIDQIAEETRKAMAKLLAA